MDPSRRRNFWKNTTGSLRESGRKLAQTMFAALHLVLRLEGKSPGMNQLVRVLALDLGDAAFRPDIVTHTPGAASEIGDALSQ